MTLRPAKLLPIKIESSTGVPPFPEPDDPFDIWTGNYYLWDLDIVVFKQNHSSIEFGSYMTYDGLDVKVGDCVVSNGKGRVLEIIEIFSQTDINVKCKARDIRRENTFSDDNSQGRSDIPTGDGFIFEMVNDLPVLYPLPDELPENIPSTFGVQLLSKFLKYKTFDMNIPDWLQDFIDNVTPEQPPNLNYITLEWDGGDDEVFGSKIKISKNAKNLPNDVPAGSYIHQFLNPSKEIFTKATDYFIPANKGTLTVYANDVSSGTINLEVLGPVFPYRKQNLEIVNRKKIPDYLPFYTALSAKGYITNIVERGIHWVQLKNSENQKSNRLLVAVPEITNPNVFNINSEITDPGTNAYVYSSGIPHLSNGTKFSVNFTLKGLAGDTFLENNIADVILKDDKSAHNKVTLNTGENNIPLILEKNNPDINSFVEYTLNDIPIALSGSFNVQARNPYFESLVSQDDKIINVINVDKDVYLEDRILEKQIPVIDLGPGLSPYPDIQNDFAFRVPFNPKFPSGYIDWNKNFDEKAWDSTKKLDTQDLSHEAVIHGGKLSWDNTDWSSNIIVPKGPNYNIETRNNVSQYATFAFRRRYISRFKINIKGTYENIFVHFPTMEPNKNLYTMRDWGPEVSGIPTNGVAFDKLITYDPTTGKNDPNGIARSGSYICTLGSLNSSNSYNNMIVVIVELKKGQSLDFLSFSSTETPDIEI